VVPGVTFLTHARADAPSRCSDGEGASHYDVRRMLATAEGRGVVGSGWEKRRRSTSPFPSA